MEIAEWIDSPAPLPENPANDLLTKMLVPLPYKGPEKKADKKAPGTRKGLRSKVVQDPSEDDEAHSSPEGEEEEEEEAAPSGKDGGPETVNQGARRGSRRKAVIPLLSDDDEADSSRGGGEEQGETPPPRIEGGKKRKAAPVGETGTSKKGKASLPDYSATTADSEEGWLPRKKPLVRS